MAARTAAAIPSVYRKLVGISLSEKFQEAVKIETVSTPTVGPRKLLVKNKYAGINASDINWTAGRYIPGLKPPFDTGFEALGEVVQVGKDCGSFKPGDAVCYMRSGAFGEYTVLPARLAIPTPNLDPQYLTFLVSGLTASIALEKVGQLQKGDTVLVTAAAGGTGQFAIQLAKLAGCHVIGTCSSDDKCQFLQRLGCDRPVNYKKEDLGEVLKREYPKGINVVYEGVGGEMFNTCVKNLAVGGRVIVIGFISNYKNGNFASRPNIPLYQILLSKSASVRGFFLQNHEADMPSHFAKLVQLHSAGKLTSAVDMGERYSGGPFKGLESVFNAVDYLYTGKSSGKVVVDLDPENSFPIPSKL